MSLDQVRVGALAISWRRRHHELFDQSIEGGQP